MACGGLLWGLLPLQPPLCWICPAEIKRSLGRSQPAWRRSHTHAAPSFFLPCPRLDEEEVVLHVALHVPHAPHLVSEEWLVLGSQVGWRH